MTILCSWSVLTLIRSSLPKFRQNQYRQDQTREGEIKKEALIDTLDEVSISSLGYDPYEMVVIANRYHAAGKDKLYEMVLTYERTCKGSCPNAADICLMLFCLHETYDGSDGASLTGLGAFFPESRTLMQSDWRYPIVFVRGIPFYSAYLNVKSGPNICLFDVIGKLRARGKWNESPIELSQDSDLQLYAAIDEFVENDEWQISASQREQLTAAMYRQLERFLQSRRLHDDRHVAGAQLHDDPSDN